MGGHVIQDYPTKTIFSEGFVAGYKEGFKEDFIEMRCVLKKLYDAGRMDDFQKALNDKIYLNDLIQEYRENPNSELK